jgi:hypothetical protein
MSSQLPSNKASQLDIQAFLTQVSSTPVSASGKRGRLLFAMDATASREHVWDMASHNHAAMFAEADKVSGLNVQLCYYRGYGEYKVSEWTHESSELQRKLLSVSCLAGSTQIVKVLKHALKETKKNVINALVFVGDCVEEDPDYLGSLAGELGILNVPIFVFQEGHNKNASRTFSNLAKLSGGAHCHFDERSAHKLGQLLAAVAIFASGGRLALSDNSLSKDRSVQHLLEQLKG